MGEDTYSASISTASGDREGANQEASMATDGIHMHTEPGGPCSAGCAGSSGSKLVIGRDGHEPFEIGMDPWLLKKKHQQC